MPRGGKTTPSRPAPVSGPGRLSRRTDGQPVRSEGLDNPEVQYGDVGQIRQGQQIAPLPTGVPIPRVRPGARPTGAPTAGRRGIPPAVFGMPSNRPAEPPTAGLSTGPGPGPEALDLGAPVEDLREQRLMEIWMTYGNEDAAEMLQALRRERAETAARQAATPASFGSPELAGSAAIPDVPRVPMSEGDAAPRTGTVAADPYKPVSNEIAEPGEGAEQTGVEPASGEVGSEPGSDQPPGASE